MSPFTRRLEETLGQVLRRFREREIDPIRQRLETIEQRQSIEERLARLEHNAGMPVDAATKFHHGEALSTREYLDLCQRLRTPLVYGHWRPEHARWNGGGHVGDHR